MTALAREQTARNDTILAGVKWGADRPTRPTGDGRQPGIGNRHNLGSRAAQTHRAEIDPQGTGGQARGDPNPMHLDAEWPCAVGRIGRGAEIPSAGGGEDEVVVAGA